MIRSASTKAAPISVPPSISSDDSATFPAVDIVFNFESAIDPASLSFEIDPANIALVIPAALTLKASEFVSIDESSTPTESTPLEAANPSPANPVATSSFNIESCTALAAIVKAPPAATVASPLMSLYTASLTTLKSALLIVPASDTNNSSVSATSPVISA